MKKYTVIYNDSELYLIMDHVEAEDPDGARDASRFAEIGLGEDADVIVIPGHVSSELEL